MSARHEENDVYIIPPNFIETGTIFGGTIKFRNAAEALILSLLIGIPVFHLPVTLTTRIIIACLTVLPAALFAIIGIGGESLSSFVLNFFVYLKNRRIVGISEEADAPASEKPPKNQMLLRKIRQKVKPKKRTLPRSSDSAGNAGRQNRKTPGCQKPAAKGKTGSLREGKFSGRNRKPPC